MSDTEKIIMKSLKNFSKETKELYLREEVPVIHDPVTPLEFYRDWVSPNQPVLMKGAVDHWPAIKKWGIEYFRNKLADKIVTVAVTPNGYADAIAIQSDGDKSEYFVTPEEREMTMSEFLDVMEHPDKYTGVFYIQRQNSNLTQDFQELCDDVDDNIVWATEAMGQQPDAINLWMGDKRAVTSMHKDPYENIYCVVSGYKHFTLLPPTDRPWIPYKTFPTASFKETYSGHFEIIPTLSRTNSFDSGNCTSQQNTSVSNDSDTSELKDTSDSSEVLNLTNGSSDISSTPWICIDPLNPDYVKYPLYKNSNPITVRVEAGDVLYLPSMWFHHVQQSHACIAVNYWYDMQYDIKYAYFQLLDSLTNNFNI